MATLVFLHGLNTYGDDLLHVGPLTFGAMHTKLERAFRERDIDFIPVTGLGAGSPQEQADRALKFLEEVGLRDVDTDLDTDLHILGQSIGGLVARALATRTEINSRIRTIMTMGTPHEGTAAASFGIEFADKHPRWARLLASLGYDTKAKAEIFSRFTPDAMRAFNQDFPALSNIRQICLLCEVDRSEVAWPLLGLYDRLHLMTEDGVPKSDGFILCSSQCRGEIMGPFALDHFAQLGYFLQTRPSARRRSELEFERLVDTICQVVSKRDKAPPTDASVLRENT